MNFSIVNATESNLLELQRISRETFFETFAQFNTKEDMDHYLNEDLGKQQLLTELHDPNIEFYFVLNEDRPVAFLKLNLVSDKSEFQGQKTVEIARIYCQKTHQGCGIGSQLIQFTIKRAQELKAKIIWLGVWEKNDPAIQFYRNFGFTEFGTHNFILGKDVQTDILMRKDIGTP